MSDLSLLELLRELRLWRKIHGVTLPRSLYWALGPSKNRYVGTPQDESSIPWVTPVVWKQEKLRLKADDVYFRRECPDPRGRKLLKMMRWHTDCVTAQGGDVLAAGLETREPFSDVRLIEFMLATPPQYQIGLGQPKFLLRAAMKGILPEPIRQRLDKGRSARLFLSGISKHHSQLEDLVANMPDIISPFLNAERLIKTIHRVSLGDQVFDPALYGALTLVLWAHRLPWAGGMLR